MLFFILVYCLIQGAAISASPVPIPFIDERLLESTLAQTLCIVVLYGILFGAALSRYSHVCGLLSILTSVSKEARDKWLHGIHCHLQSIDFRCSSLLLVPEYILA